MGIRLLNTTESSDIMVCKKESNINDSCYYDCQYCYNELCELNENKTKKEENY